MANTDRSAAFNVTNGRLQVSGTAALNVTDELPQASGSAALNAADGFPQASPQTSPQASKNETVAAGNGGLPFCQVVKLLREGRTFSFYQLVWLLEHWRPNSVPLGRVGPAINEGIRFRSNPSLAFPTGDIEELTMVPGPVPHAQVTVNFFGLYGPTSPLPTFYTEDILNAEGTAPDHNPLSAFLDYLFHHRLISLLYRCWEKYRYYIQFQPGAADSFSQWMFALAGLGDTSLRQENPISWPRLLPFLGLLGMHTRSAAVIGQCISHYFGGLPVYVEQCVGRWVPLIDDQHNRLGAANCALGEDSTLGTAFYDRSGKCRLHLAPPDFDTFNTFFPDGETFAELCTLMRFCMRDQLEFDVQLTLKSSKVPDLQLTEEGACWLGWSTWLGPPREDEVSVIVPSRQ